MGAPLYSLVKPFVRWALHQYYAQFNADGLNEALKEEQPVIIISNHQNALIDPLLVCVENKRQVHYLARASAFKNKFAAYVLRQLNMLPVYRLRDTPDIKSANDPVFNETISRLCRNEIIGIFPEGNHGGRRNLRPLKKGFSRMALMALEQGCDPYICPVGIDYSSHYRVYGSVQLVVGDGFYASEFKGLDEIEFHRKMVAKAKEVLLPVMLNIDNEEVDKLLWRLDRMGWNREKMADFTFRQNLVKRLDSLPKEQLTVLRQLVKSMDKKLAKLNCTYDNLNQNPVSIPRRVLSRIGAWFMWPVNEIVRSLTEKAVEDPQFTATVSFVLYCVLTPLYFLLVTGLIWLIAGMYVSMAVMLFLLLSTIMYRRAKKFAWLLQRPSPKKLKDLLELKEEFLKNLPSTSL
jgi:1-acyl-sn-glycerol-3-phosphate acyltransferase